MKKGCLWSFGAVCLLFIGTFFYLEVTSGVKVIVKNGGVNPMSNVVVQTSGGSYMLGDIPPNSTKSVRVDGDGGSHVELKYTDNSGKKKHLIVDCYFERGFRGSIEAEVKSGKIVRVKNNINLGFP